MSLINTEVNHLKQLRTTTVNLLTYLKQILKANGLLYSSTQLTLLSYVQLS